VAAQRAQEEKKREFLPTIEQSLFNLQTIQQNVEQEIANTHFQIKTVSDANIYFRIVRADDMMLVTKYLCHISGGMSPTLELRGKDTLWFQKFMNEFDHIWKLAANWTPDTETTSSGRKL
jgi:hypothetical protein